MGNNFVGFYVAGMAVCDRNIAPLILQTSGMEPHDSNPGINHCWPVDRDRQHLERVEIFKSVMGSVKIWNLRSPWAFSNILRKKCGNI